MALIKVPFNLRNIHTGEIEAGYFNIGNLNFSDFEVSFKSPEVVGFDNSNELKDKINFIIEDKVLKDKIVCISTDGAIYSLDTTYFIKSRLSHRLERGVSEISYKIGEPWGDTTSLELQTTNRSTPISVMRSRYDGDIVEQLICETTAYVKSVCFCKKEDFPYKAAYVDYRDYVLSIHRRNREKKRKTELGFVGREIKKPVICLELLSPNSSRLSVIDEAEMVDGCSEFKYSFRDKFYVSPSDLRIISEDSFLKSFFEHNHGVEILNDVGQDVNSVRRNSLLIAAKYYLNASEDAYYCSDSIRYREKKMNKANPDKYRQVSHMKECYRLAKNIVEDSVGKTDDEIYGALFGLKEACRVALDDDFKRYFRINHIESIGRRELNSCQQRRPFFDFAFRLFEKTIGQNKVPLPIFTI